MLVVPDDSYWADGFAALAGFDGVVYTLLVAPNGDLVAGGEFTSINEMRVNHIAR